MACKPILVIMAAGIGSRFGGLKQMTPFGPHGEGLIDYSLYDALLAGFERVVFIVNSRIMNDFRDFIGRKMESRMDVRYVCQELDSLPASCSVPTGRVKPWGTAHAVMCCGKELDAPFCAINGDDLYGRDSLAKMYGFLSADPLPNHYAMVGFRINNTLSENGSVARGVCEVTADGYLACVTERTHIISTCDGPMFTLDKETYHRLPGDAVVSMNLWGFTPGFMDQLNAQFPAFYEKAMRCDPLKTEYFLPGVVGSLLSAGKVQVSVLSSADLWHGVTYPSDRPVVEKAIIEMTTKGKYPDSLFPLL